MKKASFRALDALNFCNAGIQTGLGPFIAIFYGSTRHWDPRQIGILLACQSLGGALVQAFVGNLVDESRRKRVVTAVAAMTVSAGALGIALGPSFASQVIVQLVIGVAVTVFPAATSAFALGLVDERELPRRLARNEAFTHGGNVAFAVVAAVVGTALALAGIFYAAAVFAAGMAGAVLFIRENEVKYEAARAGQPSSGGESAGRRSVRALFSDRRILVFAAAVVLFNASNSATLPLVGQIFARATHGRGTSSGFTAAAVFVAEVVMVGAAVLVGRRAQPWGRKPLFVVAFVLLAVRDALGIASHAPGYLIGLQALDGLAAAIYGVLLKLVTADLARGTGRFSLLQGALQSAMALGGLLSNVVFGFVARAWGFDASFGGLSAVAVAGALLYALRMAETRPDGAAAAPSRAPAG